VYYIYTFVRILKVNFSNLYCVWIGDSCVLSEESGSCVNAPHCQDFKATNKACEDVTSSRGKCFYNADGGSGATPRNCSDIVDVASCDQLKSMSLCVYANKETYPNLPGDSSSISLCTWEVSSRTCKALDSDSDPIEGDSLVVVIVVVVVTALVVAGVIAVIVYRKRAKLNAANAGKPVAAKSTEMDALISSETSSSVTKGQRRKCGFTCCIKGKWKCNYSIHFSFL
jgi:hypothetical protein